MKINVMTADDRIFTLDVDADESVENVKALLEVETGVAIAGQRLLHNGRDAPNTATLRSLRVSEGDLVIMAQGASAGAGGPASAGSLTFNTDGSAVDPRALQQHLRADSTVVAQLLNTNPDLAQAILGDDTEALQSILRRQHLQKMEVQRRQQEEIALLNADPFDLEAQRKIEEAIRQKNIDENWEAAIEHNPEAFARVIMLYVDMEVNGVPLKAFVDSGAQMTIISKSCAERCGLLRLMDRRYVGIAKGVGQSEIIGRIHVAHLKIGGKFFMCSFTVLEQSDVEFIFGLDMLRKHQCMIDLKDNVLRVGGGEISVPFLQEKDLPSHVREPQEQAGTSTSAATSSKPAASSTPQANAALSPADMEEKVSRLMQLGFDRQSCLKALALCNGNEDQAASFLFGG